MSDEKKGMLTVHFQDAVLPYVAFSLRDDYYRAMCDYILDEYAMVRSDEPKRIIEIGAGVGVSTLQIRRRYKNLEKFIAIEPSPQMKQLCSLHFMGDPKVQVLEGNAENIASLVRANTSDTFDLICMSQVVSSLHKSAEDSHLLDVFTQIKSLLSDEGACAFNLGPYEFSFPLAPYYHSFEKGEYVEANPGEIITELNHPLYQILHNRVVEIVRGELDANCQLLWPPIAARMSKEWLQAKVREAGFTKSFSLNEYLYELSGDRVLEVMRNSWNVFFRFSFADLPVDQKIDIMNRAFAQVYAHKNFEHLRKVKCYHPIAVVVMS